MATIISALNATREIPSGAERNALRDDLFRRLVAAGIPPGGVSGGEEDIGYALAAIASGGGGVAVYTASKYVSYKAQKWDALDACFSSVIGGLAGGEDSFLGCFVGCAVGDAVGLPVEGYDRGICQKYVDEVVKVGGVPGFHKSDFTFGQYSDDTQLTREMILTVVQGKGKMDAAVYAGRIAMLFQPGAYRVVGYGKQTAKAALKVRNGVHFSESGCGRGQGNGSVMRSACPEVATVMSSITHASGASIDGSIDVAMAAMYAGRTRGMPFDMCHFVAFLGKCGEISEEFRGYVRELLLLDDFEKAADRIVEIGVSNGERQWGDGISVGARQTALWALWSFMWNPNSYVDCIGAAIRVGGDVDTTAATAGAIAGARVGCSRIPIIWQEKLHDYGEWTYAELLRVGGDAYRYVEEGKITVVI